MTHPNSPEQILRDYFGYEFFRGYQREIIACLIEGDDAFALMPTGAGKSLCYQIPSMILDGVGIVVSPLIALMQDQVDALRQAGVRADYLNSSLTPAQSEMVVRRTTSGNTDLLYVAPERFLTTSFQRVLNQVRIALFAVDEAHCVSQWGHDFRPEYLKLAVMLDHFRDAPRVALTATADAVVRKEIVEKLGLSKARQFVASFDRPNIRYRVALKQNANRQLLDFIRTEHPDDSGIIYCLSRKKTESTAKMLSDAGFNAIPYHAGMDSQTRLSHQRRFQNEEGVIIVATVAFGMGIDKPDVRFVAHIDLPKNPETYYQETGRAGRDGEPADAWMIYNLADIVKSRRMLQVSQGDERFKMIQHKKSEALLGYCETAECRRRILLGYFGEHMKADCGNCDTCLGKVETWDGTVAAQKALSAVYRTGQMFGAEYLADVLLGNHTDRMRRFGHDRIKTFGVGTELNKGEWKSVFRQLVAAGLLGVDLESRGGFRLSKDSWPVLRGRRDVRLRKDPEPVTLQNKFRPVHEDITDPVLRELWNTLKALRLDIAKANNIPPYVVFHDATLREIVFRLPQTEDMLQRIRGIGMAKVERYGKPILDLIRRHVEEHGVSDSPRRADIDTTVAARHLLPTVLETFERFQQGMTPDEIAAERDLKTGTIYTHLEKAIELGFASVDEVVGLGKEEIGRIEKAIRDLPDEQKHAMSPVFEKFNGKYDYGLLRCVRSGMCDLPGKSETTPTKQMWGVRRIVCLANSRKYSQYCVAGKDVSTERFGQWVRPVGCGETGELAMRNILYEKDRLPAILDIIAVPLKDYSPGGYQTENHTIDENKPWRKSGIFSPSNLPELCDHTDSIWIDGYHTANGMNDRIPLEIVTEKIRSSLLFVKPENLCVEIGNETGGKKRIRAVFDFMGSRYRLIVTDLEIERLFLKKDAGCYPLDMHDPYLCLSLSEPYNGFCYKLAAGIVNARSS